MELTRTKMPCGTILIAAGVLVWMVSYVRVATAFDFHDETAHGNRSYGVNRLGTGYQKGDCAHCHDTLDKSICGVNELMFFAPYDSSSQTDNFCFECHKGLGSHQDRGFTNYNYSYRAGGDTSITCPTNILEAFSFVDETEGPVLNCSSDYGTSHKLTDIKNFIDGKWGYTADSNPCTACHIPHLAQRDSHTPADRGWLVCRPSGHTSTSTWQLWGDDPGERMDQHTTYQAPNAASGFEPDGSDITDGSNVTDYVTFCTDCHDSSNAINSAILGRDLHTIDWAAEKHGAATADDCGPRLVSPYSVAQCGTYVLACTDCHEPHGAPNIFLTRQKVNNGDVTVETGTGEGPVAMPSASEWAYLCGKCHSGLGNSDGHAHPTDLPPDSPEGCSQSHCHNMHEGPIYRPCGECHYHGNSTIEGTDYNEPLF
jgi:hypothetical protein